MGRESRVVVLQEENFEHLVEDATRLELTQLGKAHRSPYLNGGPRRQSNGDGGFRTVLNRKNINAEAV